MLTAGHPAAIQVQQLKPLAMASADLDEDGVADLAIGYSLSKGGAITLMRGNLDALAPQSYQSWAAAGQGRYASPFLAQANLISVPVQPGLLQVADINGDGHPDLVFAARNGSELYVLLGDGKGHFALQAPVTVAGSITALASYKAGDNRTSDVVIAGLNAASGSAVALFRAAGSGLQQRAVYTLPGVASAIEVANLDADFTPDAAIVAGGQLVVLHGRDALKGAAQLETLPLSGVAAVTSGAFRFDRHAQLQLSVLTTDGTVHVLAHSGFDAHPYTREEVAAARRESQHGGAQTLAQKAGNTGDQSWTEIESYPGAAPSSFASTAAILLHSKSSGSGGEDIVVLNPAQQEIVSVRHATAGASAAVQSHGSVLRSALSQGVAVAALSQRVSPQGADGLVVLNQGSIQPQISTPASGNVLYVNTTADTLDTNDSVRCTNGSGEACSLRDAVTYANQDSAINITDGTVDTIMVPAGTYQLTYSTGLDANGNATQHLDITGPMTIIGVAGSTTIDALANDKVFSIDPNLDLAFDTTLENLTLQNGVNSNNPASNSNADNFGGAIDWEAFGTGNLIITSSTIRNNKAVWGPGGGIFESNGPGGAGKLTLTNSTFTSNSTAEEGGGVDVSYGSAAAISGSTFSSNSAKVNVNSSDPGVLGQGGGLFIAQRGASSTPQSTISSSSFTQNQSDSDGGGIYTNTGLSITGDTSFTSNSSGGSGGGIFHDSANTGVAETTTIAAANFSQNSAVTTGGGITVGLQTTGSGNLLTVANSRFYGNTSTSGTNGLSVGEPGQSGAGGATATENWWGCNAGPTTLADGCDQAALYDAGTGSLSTDPHVVLTLGVSPNPVPVGNNLQLTASVDTNSSSSSAAGQPGILQGMTIAFSAAVGSFSDSPSSAIDASGNATASVTPSSSGTGSATATLDAETVTTPFTVNGVDHFVVSAPSSATAGTFFSVTVTAKDSGGNTLTSYAGTVHFTSTDGSAALPANSTLTGGVGTFSVTLKTAGTQTVSVDDTVTTSATGTSGGMNVSAGAATHFSVSAASPVVSYVNNQLTVTALDQYGNVATGYAGTVQFTSSDPGYVNSSGNGPLVNGIGTFNFALKTAGLQTITATDSVNSAITGTSNTITVNPGPADHFGISAPATATAGTPINFSVAAYDLYGNVATGYAGTVHFTSTDAIATLPADSTLTSGSGTFAATLVTNGTQTISATDTVNSQYTGTSGNILVSTSSFVVTNTSDAGAGSLRQALLDAGAAGAGNITFDPTAFATPQSITLSSGTLNIPSHATITGATSGSGATLKNLVTVNGGGSTSNFSVFTVGSSVTGASIANLIIANGYVNANGGGIDNSGNLAITNCTLANNYAAGTLGVGNGGGAIYNAGTLTVAGSTFANNTSAPGGAMEVDGGTVIITNSTFNGNAAINSKAGGVMFINSGAVTISNSTLAGNSALGGGGIMNYGTLTMSNSILSGNTTDDCDAPGGSSCPTNGVSGNVVGGTVSLSPLGNYGGPMQTMIPLPGSAAICAISPSTASGIDQRGFTRTTTYGATTCQDAGAAESNYSIAFVQQPSTVVQGVSMSPAPTVQLDESGVAFADGADTVTIPLTLTTGAGTVTGGSAATSATTGIVTYTGLSIDTVGASDVLTANLTQNGATTPATAIAVASNAFGVNSAVTQLAFGTSPAASVTAGGNAGSSITVKEEGAGGAVATTATDTITLTVTGPGSYAKSYSKTAVSGVATFDLSGAALTATGGYSYTASIAAKPAVTTAMASVTVTAAAAATVTVVSGSSQSETIGAAFPVPLKVAVVDQYANPVSGATVNFAAPVSGASATFAGSPATTATDGTASVTATANGTASTTAYTVTASVSGATPASFTLTNLQHATTLAVTVLPTTLVYGQAVTITAAITPSSVLTNTPGGIVTFYDSTTLLSPTKAVASAGASYTVSVPTVGSHTYAAQYGGDTNFSHSAQISATPPVVVGQAGSTLNGPASAVNLAYGAGGTVAITVAGQYSGTGIAQPSGMVSYTIGSGTAQTAAISSGTATLAIPASQAAGGYTVTVNYAGDGNYKAATQIAFSLNIGKATLTITANNATKVYGTANPAFTGSVSGQQNGDTFTESFSTSATIASPVSTYAIIPSAVGANLADYTQSITDGTLTVTQAATTTTLKISSATVTPGQSLTLSAQVVSATTGTPTGTVSFYDNGHLLDVAMMSGGAASYSASTLTPGITHTLTAIYSGDTNFTGSHTTSSASTTVAGLDFTMTLSGPASQTVVPGSTITYQVKVAPDYGLYAGTVNFAVSGLPPGATVTFSPETISAIGGPQTITVTIQTAAATAQQHAPPPPTSAGRRLAPFALAFLLLFGAGGMRRQGRNLRRMLSLAVLLLGGAATTVLSGCGSTNGFFSQTSHTYTITITATSGNLQHTSTVTLNVQ